MAITTYYEDQIKSLQDNIAREKRAEANKKQAEEIRAVYNSYLEAGFTEEQAWEIFVTLLKK